MLGRIFLCCTLISGLSGVAVAGAGAGEAEHHHEAKKDSPTFARLKKLVGTWQGEDEKHNKFQISYSLVSGGRCVKESMTMHKEAGAMDTIFCDNGDSVVVTHYCASGNQPRMKSLPADENAKTVTFDFLDATGLTTPDEGHMHKLVLETPDANRLVEKWSFFEKGKEQNVATFQYKRVNKS